MKTEKTDAEISFSPQYLIISKSESRYHQIRAQLLDTCRSPAGSPCYFVRADQDNGCICRIRAGKGAVMFYEVINHHQEGITDEDIREAMSDPANACPRPGYYYITPEIEEKLRHVRLKETHGHSVRHRELHPA